jgi:hypothetical protein
MIPYLFAVNVQAQQHIKKHAKKRGSGGRFAQPALAADFK